ncbi:MAG TPA: hypothetical protein DEG47_16795, partial [Cyanobacteria bacterium UBA11148]|nr:hypothetical protein [Cyanobacteria bacterium UBA11148]
MINNQQPTTKFQIQAVNTPEELELFLDVPAQVYANDPNWVPPLRSDIAKHFAPSNPFFSYGNLQQFIALTQTDNPSVTSATKSAA